MSRHSKNNTARGHFTYAERQMLDYGTKKQRLGRDSMRDFDACYLCLQKARDPVCCNQGHLSCRECIYENILAQRAEIQRQQAQQQADEARLAEEQAQKEAMAQQILLSEFERSQLGVLAKRDSVRKMFKDEGHKGTSTSSSLSPKTPSSSSPAVAIASPSSNKPTPTIPAGDSNSTANNNNNNKKRPLELDEAELEQRSKQERIEIAKAIEEEAKRKKSELPSFWVPSLTPSEAKEAFKATKVHTVCTASKDEHKLSLKNLIPVQFTMTVEDHGEDEAKTAKQFASCPVCVKAFTNTTRLAILKGCGHVYCEACCQKFVKKDGACQVCSKKACEKDIISMSGEGSGFAGGGAKEAVKFDVAFQ
ncbi:hypothetical protein BGW41_004810 [Actinomortierella wolfii]|nr:hypothetical protein BGW41_004810 [Actinomortierella wolfii]